MGLSPPRLFLAPLPRAGEFLAGYATLYFEVSETPLLVSQL